MLKSRVAAFAEKIEAQETAFESKLAAERDRQDHEAAAGESVP